MAQSPREKLQHERQRIDRYGEDGTLPQETTDALLEWATALDPDEDTHRYVEPNDEVGEFAVLTVQSYLREMRKVAERAYPELLDLDAETFNEMIAAMQTGDNPHVKDDGLAKTTLDVTASAARTFFWYFDVCHPEDIGLYGAASDPKHDEEDIFTRDEVRALRTHVEGARNRAILEMLLNTGQRISGIQGLRVGDVDLDGGWFCLNTDHGALKGAAKRGPNRPLLGAEPHVSNWLDKHPFADESDAYLFIGDPDHHRSKPDEPLCQGTIRRMLELTADRAGVDKPVNPHNFRHYWTTTMKQEYGLNDEEIKLLLGHDSVSIDVNRVYNHVLESKLEISLESKLGDSGKPVEKSLTPAACEECGESLEVHWRACPVCGTAYGPTADTL